MKEPTQEHGRGANGNKAIAEALEIWKEYWPYIEVLTPYERYLLRHIDAGLRYVAERIT